MEFNSTLMLIYLIMLSSLQHLKVQ